MTIHDQLRAAFPSEPITSKSAFKAWGTTYLDAEDYARQLDGRTWEQLDSAYLALRSDALGFLGTRHLVAVLPAYLVALLEHPSSDVPGMLTSILTDPGNEQRSGLGKKRFAELVEALTLSQRAAVASTLQRFSEEHPETDVGRVALESIWKDFLPVGT